MKDKYFLQMEDSEPNKESEMEQSNKVNEEDEAYQFDGYVIEVNTTVVLTPVLQIKS